jgi:hypothetical protein
LLTVTVLVKPFALNAPLPILLTSLEEACKVEAIAYLAKRNVGQIRGQLRVGRK